MASKQKDIGLILEKSLLPSVAKSFTNKFPNLHCKAILQGSSKLEGELKINKQSRYQNLLNAQKKVQSLVGIFLKFCKNMIKTHNVSKWKHFQTLQMFA